MKKLFLTSISLLSFNLGFCDIIHVDGDRKITTTNNITIIRCKYSPSCCATIFVPINIGTETARVFLPDPNNCSEGTYFDARNVQIRNEANETVIICELP